MKKFLVIALLIIVNNSLYGKEVEILSKVEITKLYHIGCRFYKGYLRKSVILGDIYGYSRLGNRVFSYDAEYVPVVYASLHNNNGHTWKVNVTDNNNCRYTWVPKQNNKDFISEFNKAEGGWYLEVGYAIYIFFTKKVDKEWSGAGVILKVSYQHNGEGKRKVSKAKTHTHDVKLYPTIIVA